MKRERTIVRLLICFFHVLVVSLPELYSDTLGVHLAYEQPKWTCIEELLLAEMTNPELKNLFFLSPHNFGPELSLAVASDVFFSLL